LCAVNKLETRGDLIAGNGPTAKPLVRSTGFIRILGMWKLTHSMFVV